MSTDEVKRKTGVSTKKNLNDKLKGRKMGVVARLNSIIATLIYFYSILIVLRIFLSWLPSINWDHQPMKFVRIITDAYLDIFRRFVPPLGGLDFSPIVALLVLSIIQEIFVRAVSMMG